MRRSLQTAVVLLIVVQLLLTAASLLAQSGTQPEPPAEATPEAVDCARLADEQAALAARLESFADDLATDEASALAALYEVGAAYQRIALACGFIPPDAGKLVIGDATLERVLEILDTLDADPLNGQLLYNGELAAAGGSALTCSSCHMDAEVAPLTEGTWTRWDEQRSLLPEYADEPFAYYVAESILHPSVYAADGYNPNAMPGIYHFQLGFQDLADLIVYLESQDQLLDE
jgi:hypothetical protein